MNALNIALCTGISLGALSTGCGSSDTSTGAGGSGTSTTVSTTTAIASTTTASSGASTSVSTTASTGSSSGQGGGGFAPDFYAATIHGQLFTTDMAQAKTAHDGVAQGGQTQAEAAGDFAHDVLLGTSLLGTTANEFRAIDRWHSEAGMKAFYTNPAIEQAFGQLFAAPPTIELFGHAPAWYGWGTIDSADAVSPHYFAVIRAHLKSADYAQNQQTHDAIAQGGETQATALGDLGHVVFLGLDDQREFLAVDLWSNTDGPVTLYTNPSFQAAFAQLFDTVDVRIYASTDWYQW
jgi:hypothetical protein